MTAMPQRLIPLLLVTLLLAGTACQAQQLDQHDRQQALANPRGERDEIGIPRALVAQHRQLGPQAGGERARGQQDSVSVHGRGFRWLGLRGGGRSRFRSAIDPGRVTGEYRTACAQGQRSRCLRTTDERLCSAQWPAVRQRQSGAAA